MVVPLAVFLLLKADISVHHTESMSSSTFLAYRTSNIAIKLKPRAKHGVSC